MYGWQVAHFAVLSHLCADDYAKAGYMMHSVMYPEWNKLSAVVYSALMSAAMHGLMFYNIVSLPSFLPLAALLNVATAYNVYKFYKLGDRASARKCLLFLYAAMAYFFVFAALTTPKCKKFVREQLESVFRSESCKSIDRTLSNSCVFRPLFIYSLHAVPYLFSYLSNQDNTCPLRVPPKHVQPRNT